MTAGIVLVVLAILVVVGIFVATYKLINRLPHDDRGGNGDGDSTE